MKLAYSPGPWHVARYGTPQGKKQTIIQGVASNVCRMDISGRLQQTLDDDALLIAAAPDLLVTLEHILADPFTVISKRSIELARAAIAAAKGE